MNKREELFFDRGILMWGLRIVIPEVLRQQLLQELHVGHFGIVKMKNKARSYIWWPNIDKDIENMAKSCIPCLSNKVAPPKAHLTPWPLETKVWNRIHIDFCGPIRNKMFLIIIDAYSKWLECIEMKTMTTEETIEKMREVVARYGLPNVLVSDNGRQLVSDKFEEFLRSNGIQHITSPPGNSQSNGLAENAVKTFKNKMKTLLAEEKNNSVSLSTLVATFLMDYRTTTHQTTGVTPASLMFNRETRNKLTILSEDGESNEQLQIVDNMQKAARQQEKNYGGRYRKFDRGDNVMVRDYRKVNVKSWVKAVIHRKIGKSVYLCCLESGETWKRHVNQIWKRQNNGRRDWGERESGDAESRNDITNAVSKIALKPQEPTSAPTPSVEVIKIAPTLVNVNNGTVARSHDLSNAVFDTLVVSNNVCTPGNNTVANTNETVIADSIGDKDISRIAKVRSNNVNICCRKREDKVDTEDAEGTGDKGKKLISRPQRDKRLPRRLRDYVMELV
ncbi:uncharacterized protein K02A2.6 [Anoplophora glabripennis]|uniref:uncharacterized protein K02A2.6 n=1 Tax=Anoplophora glabripennis TaxID=217634 RepID=UPI0008749054|nr:uncharacterized protein K02A2.6 [Anoplophora glabripennis]